MDSALVVSCTEKSIDFFTQMLNAVSCNQIAILNSCAQARRLLLERDFDLIIINAPLHDESGENLACHIASTGVSQVILVVKNEFYEQVSAVTEDYGIFTISKPVNKNIFWSALKIVNSALSKIKKIQEENNKLTQKIEDIRVVDRAKCVLISYLKISEEQAHKYIEKHAMDMRTTKREIAEQVLKTYDN